MRLFTGSFGFVAVILLAASLGGGSCSRPVPDDVNAQWELSNPQKVSAQSESLDLKVTRIGCASGFTGDITVTQVNYSTENVAVGIVVEPLKDRAQTCQSNQTVSYTLDLSEPLGERTLIDLSCAETSDADGSTENCQSEAVRWKP